MSHPLRHTVNCSILFTELPLLERPAAARRAGFGAVEFWWPFAEAVPAGPAGRRVRRRDRGRRRPADRPQLLRRRHAGRRPRPGVLAEAVERVPRQRRRRRRDRRAARRPGLQRPLRQPGRRAAPRPSRTSWPSRTSPWPPTRRRGSAPPCWSSRSAARTAYPLRTAADALAVIDRVQAAYDVPNLGLLADLYHLAVNGDDVDRVIAEHTDRVAHVQIADAPGRGEPGTGDLPLDQQLSALAAQRATTAGSAWSTSRPPRTDESFGWLPSSAARPSATAGD